jgi:hypothetical protein
MEFLSHTIVDGRLQPNQAKVDALASYMRPCTAKQTLAFLGLESQFICNFDEIASLLIEIGAYKGREFVWSEACQKAFDTLRMHLIAPEQGIL